MLIVSSVMIVKIRVLIFVWNKLVFIVEIPSFRLCFRIWWWASLWEFVPSTRPVNAGFLESLTLVLHSLIELDEILVCLELNWSWDFICLFFTRLGGSFANKTAAILLLNYIIQSLITDFVIFRYTTFFYKFVHKEHCNSQRSKLKNICKKPQILRNHT